MKITICASIAFYKEMVDIKNALELLGHEVKLPPSELKNEEGKMMSVLDYYHQRKSETRDDSLVWDIKQEAMRVHFEKIEWSDAILVLNYNKGGIDNYIGGNTFLEMGLAFYLNKKIYLLKGIPEIAYKEEILGMKPKLILGDLSQIN